MTELKSHPSQRQAGNGFEITTVDRPTHQEVHLTLRPRLGESPLTIVRRLASLLREREARVVRQEIFGQLAAQPRTMAALEHELGGLDWPVTWVEGEGHSSAGISGMHVFGIAGTRVDTIDSDERIVGRIYEDGHGRHCLLGNVGPSDLSLTRSDQCRQTFERIERILDRAGMSMANVTRTWFFLDEIHSWYRQFNAVRNEFYRQNNLFRGIVPASTGIGGMNPARAALVAGVWATQKMSNDMTISELPSPLQCPSLKYGSAFSRAVLNTAPDSQRLWISGTASIAPDGQSMHGGDVRGQVALSMEVVEQILASAGFRFSNITRATAYCKSLLAFSVFDWWRAERGLDFLPVVATEAEICREELLFEIELDAIAVSPKKVSDHGKVHSGSYSQPSLPCVRS